VKEKVLPFDYKLRRVKYLNNVIEQDHRATRRRWRAIAMLSLVPHGGTDDRRHRGVAHDEEGSTEKHPLRFGKIDPWAKLREALPINKVADTI
jgi:hypothetical protein